MRDHDASGAGGRGCMVRLRRDAICPRTLAVWKGQRPEAKIRSRPRHFPADYISEAVDQTRGWFYTLLAVATLLGYKAPYKNVICLGHINDKHGQKMSKSKGNIVDPWATMANLRRGRGAMVFLYGDAARRTEEF